MENNIKQYSKEWFLLKYSSISEENWGSGNLNNHCILWHCGATDYDKGLTEEAKALIKLFGGTKAKDVYEINDLRNTFKHLGSTPKERIMNKLLSLPDTKEEDIIVEQAEMAC
jgi:hypothetical protein